MAAMDDDTAMRMAAFAHVRRLSAVHDILTHEQLKEGFTYQGNRVPLVNPQRGIFKPRSMRYLLSVKTVFPKPGGRVWYDDQRQVHAQIFAGVEAIDYAFMGDNPDAADNRWLREAYENATPIIYFLGVAPGRYQAVLPVFLSGWDRHALKAQLVVGETQGESISAPQDSAKRRYALRTVKQRLHQAQFREAVLQAYGGRCALSNFPEGRLLDAAHIMSDTDDKMGQPIVQNGLPLSKLHHGAFDADLIGISPDFIIHVSDRLMDQNDGPLLEAMKGLNGQPLHLPSRKSDWPDRERLEARFARYRAAA